MKTDMRVIKTKKALKESLVELLKKETFERITVSEICENAFVNRVTFYTHYQDKYELFADYLKDIENSLYQKTITQIKDGTEKQRLISFTTSLLDNITETCIEYKDVLVTFGNQENSMLLFIIEKAALKDITELIKQFFNPKKLKYKPEFIASFIVGGYSKVVTEWHDSKNTMSLNEMKEEFYRLIKDIINSNIITYN